VDRAARRCAATHCAKHYRVPTRWECRLHWANWHVVPEQPGFKTGGLHHLGLGALQERVYKGGKFDADDELKQAIVLQWRALPQRFIDPNHSISEWRHHRGPETEWRAHWTLLCFINYLYCKIVDTDVHWNTNTCIFWSSAVVHVVPIRSTFYNICTSLKTSHCNASRWKPQHRRMYGLLKLYRSVTDRRTDRQSRHIYHRN